MFLIVPFEMHSYLGMKELTLKNLNYWLVCSVYLVVQCSTSCYRHSNKVSHQIPIMLSWFVVAVWLLLDTLLSFCCSLWVDCHRFSCQFLLSFSLDDTVFVVTVLFRIAVTDQVCILLSSFWYSHVICFHVYPIK